MISSGSPSAIMFTTWSWLWNSRPAAESAAWIENPQRSTSAVAAVDPSS
jgi:hypothetical protein